MPYSHTLQTYLPAAVWREPPREWVRRLEEISPDLPNLDRLIFRFRDGMDPLDGNASWANDDARARGVWVLYTAKPVRLIEKARAAQFEKHWSELDETQREGRRAVVSDYQHFMWHARGLYVQPFLILQGEWGGTPAKYTEQERAFLKASHCLDEPFDIGMFPPCPFDERVVRQIVTRDRLLQQSNSYGHLEELDTSEGLGREFADAEVVRRTTYLDTWREMIQPAVEFYKRIYTTKSFTEQPDQILPPAPAGLSNTLAQWREKFLETGEIVGATPARQRAITNVTISVT